MTKGIQIASCGRYHDSVSGKPIAHECSIRAEAASVSRANNPIEAEERPARLPIRSRSDASGDAPLYERGYEDGFEQAKRQLQERTSGQVARAGNPVPSARPPVVTRDDVHAMRSVGGVRPSVSRARNPASPSFAHGYHGNPVERPARTVPPGNKDVFPPPTRPQRSSNPVRSSGDSSWPPGVPQPTEEGRCRLMEAMYNVNPDNPLPAPSCEDLKLRYGGKVKELEDNALAALNRSEQGRMQRAANPLPETATPAAPPPPAPPVAPKASSVAKADSAAGTKNILWRTRNLLIDPGMRNVLGMIDVPSEAKGLRRLKSERNKVSLSMIDAALSDLNVHLSKGSFSSKKIVGESGKKSLSEADVAKLLQHDLQTERNTYQRNATIANDGLDQADYGIADESKVRLSSN